MTPQFRPGSNIAIKVPPHEYEQTVSFYRDTIGLEETDMGSPDQGESVCFEFGNKRLWIDKVASLSQAEVWLELVAEDMDAAAKYLEGRGVVRRDGVERLPEDFKGFWICSPSNIIHLVTASDN